MAKKIPVETILHGQKRVDDYAWLENKGAPDVVEYLEAENAYTARMTHATEALQKTLYDEMLGRIKEDDSTPPYVNGGYTYYWRFEKGKQYTLKTKDLRTNKLGTEAIPRVASVEWAKDGKTLLYVTEDEQTKRSNKLFRHVLGADASKDTLVYEEKDEMFDLSIDRTRSNAFAIVTSTSRTTSEVRVIDSRKPTSAPVLITPREKDHEYYVSHRGDTFYIRTNSGGRNFRLVTAPVADPQRSKWKELLPHRTDVMLEGMSLSVDARPHEL